MSCLPGMPFAVVCEQRSRYFVVPLVVGISMALPTFGADIDSSHVLSGRSAVGIEETGTQLLDLSWRPKVQWRFEDGGRLTGIARLRFQAEPGTRPGDIERGSYASISRPALIGDNAELELREFFYERSLGDWYLTLGKQQVVWGKADGLKVLDVVNPQSFREFILEDFDQSRIPLWTVNAEYAFSDRSGNDWTLQLLWIPDQTYHALPKRGATYAFTSPRLIPQTPPGIDIQLNDPQRPVRVIRDSDAGLRLTGFLDGWDLTLNYLYQYDNQPALHQQLQPGPTVVITPRYHRTHVLGGTFSRAFGDWVLRGEIGYFTNRFFLTDDLHDDDGVAQSAELSYVLGLDWSGITDTFISGQLFQSRLTNYQTGFIRPEVDTSFTFLVRRMFWNDTLTTEVLWIVNTNDGDGLIRPKVSYDLDDNLEVWVGLDVFYGNRQGLFGQFTDNDRVLLGVKLGL